MSENSQYKGNYGEESWVLKYSNHLNTSNTVNCYLQTLKKQWAYTQVSTAPLETAAAVSSYLLAQ